MIIGGHNNGFGPFERIALPDDLRHFTQTVRYKIILRIFVLFGIKKV